MVATETLLTTLPSWAGGEPLSNLQVSGGVDGRLIWDNVNNAQPVLEGVFLNLRKVFADEMGDRWILSLQGDVDENLKEIRSYQSFLQYKGPLGKWNIRGGHYILPFGLLNSYDTERLLLQTLENDTIGIKLDTGLEGFGYLDDWNWAVSASSGLGRHWLGDYNNTGLAVLRLGRGWEDGFQAGLSFLAGTVQISEESTALQPNQLLHEQKAALDATYEADQWSLRGELQAGNEDSGAMGGFTALADYALNDTWEVNLKYMALLRSASFQEGGAGLTFKPGSGFAFRAADEVSTVGGATQNQILLQAYYEFSKTN